jgi:hypothetical protein
MDGWMDGWMEEGSISQDQEILGVGAGNSLNRGKGMTPQVQLSTNYRPGCFRYKTNFFSGLTTVKAVDPLSVDRDFPG